MIEARRMLEYIVRMSEAPKGTLSHGREAKVFTAGVDIGSMTAKTVILADNQVIASNVLLTGSSSAESAWKSMNQALAEIGDMKLEDIHFVVGTGYGRFNVPFAQKNLTEISCHARGAHYYFPRVRTILDMGGQDCKAIHCDGAGKVTSFLMNDKCAAGTGRSMEVLASLLSMPLADLGGRSLEIEKEPPPASSTCIVFARSEVLALLRKGNPVNEIIAAYCDGLANRVANLIKRVGMEEDFVITGGIAKNIGVVTRLLLRFPGIKAYIPHEPQIVGALGAALLARDLLEKQRARAAASAPSA